MASRPKQNMISRLTGHRAQTLIAWALLATLASADATALGGTAALTTDYVWRGSTQTQGDPAVQVGFKATANSGWYVSAWGSNVEFAPDVRASTEFDFTAGWAGALNENWALDVNVLHYRYPSTTIDLNWAELNSVATFRDRHWASVGYSHQALGYDAPGLYAQLGTRAPLSERFRIEAMLSHYFLDDAVVATSGYTHGQVNAVWAIRAPMELRLSAHATDSDAKRIFGDEFAGSRFEASLQTSF